MFYINGFISHGITQLYDVMSQFPHFHNLRLMISNNNTFFTSCIGVTQVSVCKLRCHVVNWITKRC
jgi:hypothetical protein